MSYRIHLEGLVTELLTSTSDDDAPDQGVASDPSSFESWKDEYLTLAVDLARSYNSFTHNLAYIRAKVRGTEYADIWSGTDNRNDPPKIRDGPLSRRYWEMTKTELTDGKLVASKAGFDNMKERLDEIAQHIGQSIGPETSTAPQKPAMGQVTEASSVQSTQQKDMAEGKDEGEAIEEIPLPDDVKTGSSLPTIFEVVREHLNRSRYSFDRLRSFLEGKNAFESPEAEMSNLTLRSADTSSTLGKRSADSDDDGHDSQGEGGIEKKRKKKEPDYHPLGDIDDLLENCGW